MNQAIKDLWIQSLTSGNYVQGREWLRSINDEYCCLGVLCDLHAQYTLDEGMWIDTERGHYAYVLDGHKQGTGYAAVLPARVIMWAGLDSHTANVTYEGEDVNMAFLNDTRKLSFAELVEVIKEQL